jgi:hypothetical protein
LLGLNSEEILTAINMYLEEPWMDKTVQVKLDEYVKQYLQDYIKFK